MSALKYFDTTTSQWKYLVTGPQGPTGPAGPASGTIGRKVIAASNTPSAYADRADITCSGTADQTILTDYINTGPVYLLPGTYNLSGSIDISVENPDVEGTGWSTVFHNATAMNSYGFTSNTPPGNGVRGRFANFMFDGNGANQGGGGGFHSKGFVQSVFSFIHFTNCYDNGIWFDAFPGGAFGHHNKVLDCLFDNTVTMAGTGIGLKIESTDENTISSEFQYLGGGGTPTYAVRDLSGLNQFRNSVFVGGRNNMGGIEVRNGKDSSILGCTFDGVSGDNVFLASTKGTDVSHNTFVSVADQANVNNTYSGIHLEYGAMYNRIADNNFLTSATSTRSRSYIREEAAGGTGVNIIKDNIGRVQGTGLLGSAAYDLNGTASVYANNIAA